MNDRLENLCEKFIWNRDLLAEGFRSAGKSAVHFPVCSLIFTAHGKDADPDLMRESIRLIRENGRALSGFRGFGLFPMAAMMAASEAPERRFEKAVTLCGLLRQKFPGSDLLPVAAMASADLAPEGKYIALVERAAVIFGNMTALHEKITGADDHLPALMLAMSEQSDEVINREIEVSFKILSQKFRNKNAVQAMSQILTMTGGRAPDKAKRVCDLWDALREEKCTFPRGEELASLGVLSLFPANIPTLSEEVSEADEFLSRQKGYGILGIGKSERRMHAATLVSAEHLFPDDTSAMDEAALSAAMAPIAAQQSVIVSMIGRFAAKTK